MRKPVLEYCPIKRKLIKKLYVPEKDDWLPLEECQEFLQLFEKKFPYAFYLYRIGLPVGKEWLERNINRIY